VHVSKTKPHMYCTKIECGFRVKSAFDKKPFVNEKCVFTYKNVGLAIISKKKLFSYFLKVLNSVQAPGLHSTLILAEESDRPLFHTY
jgi:hypothetical protein